MLKQAHSNASTTTTIDQASSNDAHAKAQHQEWELDVTEDPPTTDQVLTIMEYLGEDSAGKVVQGATDEDEAMRKFKLNESSFIKPVVRWCGPGQHAFHTSTRGAWTPAIGFIC